MYNCKSFAILLFFLLKSFFNFERNSIAVFSGILADGKSGWEGRFRGAKGRSRLD